MLTAQPGARSPHETFYYYYQSFRLGAVRSGQWKLMIAPTGRGFDVPAVPTKQPAAPQLFDLAADPAETTDVAAAHPDIVARLQQLAERARADLGDSAQSHPGRGQRAPGRLADAAKP